MAPWLRRSSSQPSHPTQGVSRKRQGRGLGRRWRHRRSLQQREVTWFEVSFFVWVFGAHPQVCVRVYAVQCVERIVREPSACTAALKSIRRISLGACTAVLWRRRVEGFAAAHPGAASEVNTLQV